MLGLARAQVHTEDCLGDKEPSARSTDGRCDQDPLRLMSAQKGEGVWYAVVMHGKHSLSIFR